MSNILKQPELHTNRLLHGDIEARGYLDNVHKHEHVWCLVLKDDESGRRYVFHDYPEYDNAEVEDGGKIYTIQPRDGGLLTGIRFLYLAGTNGSTLAIHNLQTYDKPLIEKIWPKCKLPDECWEDTFICSKIQFFDRPIKKGAKSAHGLENYARMSGDTHKPKVEDFSVMNAYMLHRCIMDVDIQEFCTRYLRKERDLLKAKNGIDFTEAYKMEFEYARTCFEQEQTGAMADRPHMEKCVETWDVRLHELESIIEPMLPPTVKVTGGKVSRKEMAILLGYPKHVTDKMHEPTEMRKRNGEDVEYVIKPYAKPTVKWTTVKKTNQYSGMHISYGFSPSFIKKAELTKWIKENHPDTKPKEWDIEKTEIQAELVNANNCKYFDIEPEDTNLIGGAFTKVKFVASTLTQHEVVKGELIKAGVKYALEWNFKKDSNKQMVKADKDMVVSYPPKAAYENQLHYTVKKGEPIVSSPKFGDKEMEQLEDDFGKQIAEYNTTMHRRRFLLNPKDPEEKGLIANIREDGRLPCGVGNFMTATGRAAHRVWVNAAGAGSLYGEEIRRCIVASSGKKLVSSDMNSAQLSIAAYYANNYDYFKAVCYGQEFKVDDKGNEIIHPETGQPWFIGESGHCVNSRAFELISEDEWKRAVEDQDQDLIHSMGLRRKKSKAGTFGTIFGCSGKKLALMLGIDEGRGNEKKNAFLSNLGLDRVIEILDRMCTKNSRGGSGIIELPFGYHATCKSPHARFNYLDQGTEAACQKWAELYFDRESKKLGLQARRILSYHK